MFSELYCASCGHLRCTCCTVYLLYALCICGTNCVICGTVYGLFWILVVLYICCTVHCVLVVRCVLMF